MQLLFHWLNIQRSGKRRLSPGFGREELATRGETFRLCPPFIITADGHQLVRREIFQTPFFLFFRWSGCQSTGPVDVSLVAFISVCFEPFRLFSFSFFFCFPVDSTMSKTLANRSSSQRFLFLGPTCELLMLFDFQLCLPASPVIAGC